MVHQHIYATSIDQHICAILIFSTDFQGQPDSHCSFLLLFSCVGGEDGFVYKALLSPQACLTLTSQISPNFTKYLQPARPTYSLPATPTACPPHLQPARYTYSSPATPSSLTIQ